MATTITIAVPTHNRAASLAATLHSIAVQRVERDIELECLVVDNASADETASVVREFSASSPIPCRYVREDALGSSFARNSAISESGGEFVFFIDDDAIAEPDWVAQLFDALKTRSLDAVCGMVVAQWSAAPPPWLGPSLWVKLAVHDPVAIAAMIPADTERLENYFSANVGFRRSSLDRFGTFREDLGVVGGNPISGEDTELFARIIESGGKMGFAPRAIVRHVIPVERMTLAYLRRKSFAFGIGSAYEPARSHNSIDKLVRNAVRMTAAAIRGDREGAIRHELECLNFLGYWRGRWGGVRERRRST
jgi:glycosyltransferase involved in cell wall biosynthesis